MIKKKYSRKHRVNKKTKKLNVRRIRTQLGGARIPGGHQHEQRPGKKPEKRSFRNLFGRKSKKVVPGEESHSNRLGSIVKPTAKQREMMETQPLRGLSRRSVGESGAQVAMQRPPGYGGPMPTIVASRQPPGEQPRASNAEQLASRVAAVKAVEGQPVRRQTENENTFGFNKEFTSPIIGRRQSTGSEQEQETFGFGNTVQGSVFSEEVVKSAREAAAARHESGSLVTNPARILPVPPPMLGGPPPPPATPPMFGGPPPAPAAPPPRLGGPSSGKRNSQTSTSTGPVNPLLAEIRAGTPLKKVKTPEETNIASIIGNEIIKNISTKGNAATSEDQKKYQMSTEAKETFASSKGNIAAAVERRKMKMELKNALNAVQRNPTVLAEIKRNLGVEEGINLNMSHITTEAHQTALFDAAKKVLPAEEEKLSNAEQHKQRVAEKEKILARMAEAEKNKAKRLGQTLPSQTTEKQIKPATVTRSKAAQALAGRKSNVTGSSVGLLTPGELRAKLALASKPTEEEKAPNSFTALMAEALQAKFREARRNSVSKKPEEEAEETKAEEKKAEENKGKKRALLPPEAQKAQAETVALLPPPPPPPPPPLPPNLVQSSQEPAKSNKPPTPPPQKSKPRFVPTTREKSSIVASLEESPAFKGAIRRRLASTASTASIANPTWAEGSEA